MATLDDFLAVSGPQRSKCAIGKALDRLSDTDRTVLAAALEHPLVMHVRIAEKMQELWDIPVSQGQVGHHRRHGCGCG